MAASAFNCCALCVNCTQSVRQLECAHTHTHLNICVCVCAYPRSTLPHSPTKAAVLTYRTFWLLSLSPVWLLHNFIHSVENDNINFVFYLCDSCPGRINERERPHFKLTQNMFRGFPHNCLIGASSAVQCRQPCAIIMGFSECCNT